MVFPAFVGPAYRSRSTSINADALINLFVETTPLEGSVKRAALYGTPGRRFLLTVPNGNIICRGLFQQDGRVFAVVGAGLYEVNVTTAVATYLGAVANNGKRVSFASNGRGGEQLILVSGGILYLLTLTTNVLTTPVTHNVYGLELCGFMDGYFFVTEVGTIRIWFSALENGATWNALDFFSRSHTSDNNIGMQIVRDRIAVFGSQTSELFYDNGDTSNPFQPYPGSVMQDGATSAYGLALAGEQVYWCSQDNQGDHRIATTTGFTPEIISTPAISFALASYATIADVEADAFEQEGHSFIAWTFPTANVTWCYDVVEKTWHQRADWDANLGVDLKWGTRGVCSTSAGLLCGDWTTGNLYILDMDTFTNNALPMRRLRRLPYFSQENQWLFLDRFEVGLQAGVGLTTGQGVAPQLLLNVSRDGAQTWVSAGMAGGGALGQYTTRAVWRMLGRSRADRLVLEVSQTDPVRAVWGPSAYVKVRPGSGAL